VGRWATPDDFYQQAQLGRTMWGGLTAGDWHYIGSQGVLQGTYEILCAVARQHFDGSLGVFCQTSYPGACPGRRERLTEVAEPLPSIGFQHTPSLTDFSLNRKTS
jgi:urocanate hydratase